MRTRVALLCTWLTFFLSACGGSNYYKTSTVQSTEQIQTFGDSLIDLSLPLKGFCDDKRYGGVAQSINCFAQLERQELAGSFQSIIYRDNSRTGAKLSEIISQQYYPVLDNSNVKTAIFNGGANDLSSLGCQTEATTGTRDYSRLYLSDPGILAILMSTMSLIELNQLYVIVGDAMAALSDSQIDQYIALLAQPISQTCVNLMQEIDSKLSLVLAQTDNSSLKDIIVIGSPYFNLYTNNQTDYSAAIQSRVCRTSSKCTFVDTRSLWQSMDGNSLQAISREFSAEECQSRIDEPEFTGQYCYPDDYTWDQNSANVHFNGAGSYLISKLVYEKMKAADVCRLPGMGKCVE